MLIVLAVIAAAAWGASDFFGGTPRGRESVVAFVAASQLLGLGVLVPVLVLHGHPLPSDPRVWLACLGGLGATLELRLVYTAIARGDAFITAPVGAFGAAIAVLFGLVSGDHLTPAIGGGLLLALLGGGGCAVTGGSRGGARRSSRTATASLCAGASLGVACALVSLHAAGRVDPVWSATLLDASTALAATLLTLCGRGALRERLPGRDRLPAVGLVAVSGSGGDLAYAAASGHGALSVLSAISSLYPIATMLLGVSLRGQRARGAQLAAIALALGGAALLGAAAG